MYGGHCSPSSLFDAGCPEAPKEGRPARSANMSTEAWTFTVGVGLTPNAAPIPSQLDTETARAPSINRGSSWAVTLMRNPPAHSERRSRARRSGPQNLPTRGFALAIGAAAMLTSGQPNSEAAIAFGGGCASAAAALLVLDSALA